MKLINNSKSKRYCWEIRLGYRKERVVWFGRVRGWMIASGGVVCLVILDANYTQPKKWPTNSTKYTLTSFNSKHIQLKFPYIDCPISKEPPNIIVLFLSHTKRKKKKKEKSWCFNTFSLNLKCQILIFKRKMFLILTTTTNLYFWEKRLFDKIKTKPHVGF